MEDKKLSIVIVSFNSDATIKRTFESLASQDGNDQFEVLLIDGGSTDKTLQIASESGVACKIISERDDGLYDAMNKGVKLAKGKHVLFLNTDDWLYAPDVLSKALNFLDCESTIYFGRFIFHSRYGAQHVIGSEKIDLRFGLHGIHQPAIFYPRKLFLKLGGFNLKYKIAADYDIVCRMVRSANVKFVDLIVANMSDGGLSNRRVVKGLQEVRVIAEPYSGRLYGYYRYLRSLAGIVLRSVLRRIW